MELPVRFHVGEMRDPRPDPGEVIDGEPDVRLVRNREQVQHGVGRAAERHRHRDRVLEGGAGHDLSGADTPLEEADHGAPRLVGGVVAAAVDGRRRGAGGERHPERLADRGHRVGGEHPRTGALAGTGVALDLVEGLVVDLPRGVRPDRLEDAHDVEGLALPVTGQDRAGVDEHHRQVEARRRHEHARKGLVASGEADEGVEALGVHHRLDRVGDHLTADE